MVLLQNNSLPKRKLLLYFQVHQPRRLANFRFFDIGTGNACFNDELDRQIVQRVASECYLPGNAILLKLFKAYPDLRVTFSLSGVIIDQLEAYAPEVLQSFRDLAATGCVSFLSETYYHSLACMMQGGEFEVQVLKHAEKIYEHFGAQPAVFRNTELIYNDDIGMRIGKLGFTGIITEGVESILGDRSPNHLYHHPELDHLKIALRNYRLSDDIAFRFMENGKTLSAEKYVSWLHALPKQDEIVNLAIDYETFGEHQKKETGILKFLEEMLTRLASSKTYSLVTADEAMGEVKAQRALFVPNYISWADSERDLSAWLGNEMQRDAFDSLLELEFDIKNLNNEMMTQQWRNLQASDHFYYMSTKKGSDGNIHSYFSPYPSPYEAFINYMNVLTDFSMRVKILHSGRMNEPAPGKIATSQWRQSMGTRMTMMNH